MIWISAFTGIKFEIVAGKQLIGRGTHCDVIIDHNSVSREHAEVEVMSNGKVILTDKRSRNGTFVNDSQLADSTEIRVGDLVRIGAVEFRILDSSVGDKDQFPEIESPSLVSKSMKSLTAVEEDKGIFAPKLIKAISDLGKMLVMPGSEKEMLEKALVLLQDTIKFSRAAVYLADEKSNLTLVSSQTTANSNKSFIISHTVINEVLLQKNAVLIQDTAADTKYAGQNSIIAEKIGSAMAVPLLYDEKVIGIVYIDIYYPGASYTEADLQVVAIFANLLASKVVNHNILLQLKEKEALDAELAAASQIQRGLLPQRLPAVNGYQISAFQSQCLSVGGDLYDISLLKDGRIIFIIADVSGKGMGAALLASNILASFRILYNVDNFALLEAITLASDQLLHYTRPGDFATLFAGILDPQTNLFKFINAGHNSPLVVRKNGVIECLESSGIPIGIFIQHSWKESYIEIDEGDFIFAFTDGVTEATNGEGEQFGEKRLKKMLLDFEGESLPDLVAALNSEVKKFSAQAPQSDDITMIIIGREVVNRAKLPQ